MNEEIKKYILNKTNESERKMIDIRRYLHTNPELSFEENNTMQYICKNLDMLGINYTSGVAGTGVVARICGEKEADTHKNILIRADIDALPVDEKSDVDYKSQNKGIMHACGHDAHTAILLGTCEILNTLKDKFSGTVKCIFQPGEETTGGALPMIEEGVLENPHIDICLALHVDPDINTGFIRVKPGSLYGSPDDFRIVVKGRGGHGAEPHNCIDPISISAQIINSLMNIVSREISPFDEAVISIGSIHAGTASNIIPDEAEITGTARSLTNSVRDKLKKRIGEIASAICTANNAECIYEYIELFAPLINDENTSEILYTSACNILGEDKCIWGGEATMAGEDFAYFTQNRPSVLFKLGCRNEEKGIQYPLHHSQFDVDEECLKHGASVFTAFVLDYLG